MYLYFAFGDATYYGNVWPFFVTPRRLALANVKSPIVVFNRAGKFLRSFGGELVVMPHGIKAQTFTNDAEATVLWLADIGGHDVIAFDAVGTVRSVTTLCISHFKLLIFICHFP